MIKILALGDIVNTRATALLSERLWNLRSALGVDFVVANGENASAGNGLSRADALSLLAGGVDVLTSGNHVWRKNDLYSLLDEDGRILRPANYPAANPGRGWTFADAAGRRVLVVNLLGTVYLEALACPFATLERILEQTAGEYDLSLIDFHAEATAEKMALAYAFDGRVSAVVGTHTHVQTADERLLPGGTAYLTDLGMCGPDGGILGVGREEVIHRMRTKMPVRFVPAEGEIVLNGALISFENDRAAAIERIAIRP